MSEPPAATAAAPVAAGDEIVWLGLARKWWVMAVTTPSVVLAEVAVTALLLSNTLILQGLDTDMYRYQWATGPYLVLLILAPLLSVPLVASYGSQRTFLAGAVLAGAGFVVAALAESLYAMIAARLLMSAKGLVLAVALSQMWLAFPRRKGLAMAVVNAATYGGLFVGTAVGGFLEFQTSWRSIYGVAGVTFLVLAITGHRALVRDQPAQPVPLRLNPLEILLLTASIAVAVFVVLRGQYFGWFDSNLVAFSIAGGTLAFAGFVWTTLTSTDPLVNLRLAGFRTLALTLPVIALFAGAAVGMLITLPSYLQLRGYPSVVEGWILFFPGVAILSSCLASGFLYGRKTNLVALWAGLASSLAGGLWFLQADLYTAKATVSAMLCVWAAGAGLVFPTALRLTFSGQNAAAVRQLAGVKVALRSSATLLLAFTAVVIIQRGTDVGQDSLGQRVNRNNPAYAQVLERVEQHVVSRGSAPAIAKEQAAGVVGSWVAHNAQAVGQRAGRRFLLAANALALLIALFIPLRPEENLLADDARDFAWGWSDRAQPRSVTQSGNAS
ncbi:MAG: MFS transporter [Burkholderiales bacterium]